MAVYLDEDMVGTDANMIAFPHLLLCMGLVVLLDDGTMVGAHFTKPSTEKPILNMMRRSVLASGSGMSALYCASDLAEHVGRHGGLDINGKAEGLGFSGQGYIFDFGYLNPTDGAYVQFTSNGGGNRLSVRFRLNEHMSYTYGLGPTVYKAKAPGLPGVEGLSTRISQVKTRTTGAAAQNGQDLNTPFMKPVTIN